MIKIQWNSNFNIYFSSIRFYRLTIQILENDTGLNFWFGLNEIFTILIWCSTKKGKLLWQAEARYLTFLEPLCGFDSYQNWELEWPKSLYLLCTKSRYIANLFFFYDSINTTSDWFIYIIIKSMWPDIYYIWFTNRQKQDIYYLLNESDPGISFLFFFKNNIFWCRLHLNRYTKLAFDCYFVSLRC